MSLKDDKGDKFKDLNNKRFGYLVVKKFSDISVSTTNSKYKKYNWLCICDCGKESVVSRNQLISGKTKSCGHFQKTHKELPNQEGLINGLYKRYKQDSKRKGNSRKIEVEFNISKEIFTSLILKNCYYCNSIPKNKFTHSANKEKILYYNGIDRKDNSIGYIETNIVPCCLYCNQAKSSRPYEEFMNWLNNLVEYRSGIDR